MKTTYKNHPFLPYLLVAPMVSVTLVFFVWPAGQALFDSVFLTNMFGTSRKFVWFDNFFRVVSDPNYVNSLKVTAVFGIVTVVFSLAMALALAVMADAILKGSAFFKTIIILPYAVAPAVAGVLWLFLLAPPAGLISRWLVAAGIGWNPVLNGDQAFLMVTLSAIWKQVPYNFIFFLAGLQSIPRSLLEAAYVDGATFYHRFRTIVLPLLAPISFFLVVVNIIFALFDTFGIIHTVTDGGPARATETLVYKIFRDGYLMGDISGSSAQSVILMLIVILLTYFQFRFVERKIHY
jgi:sn-glycerol 3-phosphate transport system permease protein